MTQRFYFDTSVFGGMFDDEFEEESTLLFEKVKLGLIEKTVYEVDLSFFEKYKN